MSVECKSLMHVTKQLICDSSYRSYTFNLDSISVNLGFGRGNAQTALDASAVVVV